MSEIDISEFAHKSATLFRDNPSWRYGQTLFNALHILNPGLADEVRGTDKDPFHAEGQDDERIDKFWEFLDLRS